MGILGGGLHAPRGKGHFGFFVPIGLNGRMAYFLHRNAFDSCEKLTIFPYYNMSLESTFHWLSEDTVNFEVDVAFFPGSCSVLFTQATV